ncbi:MAG: hypothetical protein KAW09_02120, partial [Thermoplasmata archaeon]|nr:hypothetical protein [Thermoplasmata archaeon]
GVRFEEAINMLQKHIFPEKMDEEDPQMDSEIDLHLKKKEVVRKLAELSQNEDDLKSKEDELQDWHQRLSQREDEIKKKEEHLSLWEKELRGIAAQVAEEKRRMKETVEPDEMPTTAPGDAEIPVEEKQKTAIRAESLPEEEPIQEEPMEEEQLISDDPIEEDREQDGPRKVPLKKVKKKKKRFGLFK